jgi:predicted transcriptional regulator
MQFVTLLDDLGLTKKQFARKFGIGESTVYGWKKQEDVPYWVMIILERLSAQAQWLRGFGVKVG